MPTPSFALRRRHQIPAPGTIPPSAMDEWLRPFHPPQSRPRLKTIAPTASMDKSFFASFFSKKEALPSKTFLRPNP
jgi:hypothetical protein